MLLAAATLEYGSATLRPGSRRGGLGGLFAEWFGLVWCNPPYGDKVGEWLAKCADHGNAIALVHARTETEFFQSEVFGKAQAAFFLKGRLTFHLPSGARAKGPAGAPSVLVGYGATAAAKLQVARLAGRFLSLTRAAQYEARPKA